MYIFSASSKEPKRVFGSLIEFKSWCFFFPGVDKHFKIKKNKKLITQEASSQLSLYLRNEFNLPPQI